MDISLGDVERALHLPAFDVLRAQREMAPTARAFTRMPEKPGQPRRGGVLVLLYPLKGQLAFTLTRRTETVENHRGQISLPGGAWEQGETLAETAVREASEELGISMETAQLIGRLESLYIPPSDFEIHPFVACRPERPAFVPNPAEVAELLEVPLAALLDTGLHQVEDWVIRGYDVRVPFYHLQGHKVWGATAIVLSELEGRLRATLEKA